jgi:hypothetical protein
MRSQFIYNERGYGTSSEYVRELIRKDKNRLKLRGLLLEGARTASSASKARVSGVDRCKTKTGEDRRACSCVRGRYFLGELERDARQERALGRQSARPQHHDDAADLPRVDQGATEPTPRDGGRPSADTSAASTLEDLAAVQSVRITIRKPRGMSRAASEARERPRTACSMVKNQLWKNWLGWQDSNLRMAGSKPAILTCIINKLLILLTCWSPHLPLTPHRCHQSCH